MIACLELGTLITLSVDLPAIEGQGGNDDCTNHVILLSRLLLIGIAYLTSVKENVLLCIISKLIVIMLSNIIRFLTTQPHQSFQYLHKCNQLLDNISTQQVMFTYWLAYMFRYQPFF